MVAQGNVADELEAPRGELRATNGTIRFGTPVENTWIPPWP